MKIIQAAKVFKKHGIDSFFVGGWVRDKMLGIESDDIDICLVGVSNTKVVEDVLNSVFDSVSCEVGSAFPVWIAKDGEDKIDFALARTEKKSGETRKDFSVEVENVSIEDDLERRDLTVNAIAINCLTGTIVDPFNGTRDLENRLAREVSPAFAEDSLRVLRAARFISRFDLTPTDSLIRICKSLNADDISDERVGMELVKMFKQANKPSKFFRFLKEVDWLKFHFQEIQDIIGVEQDPEWHPEGDVFEHTMHTMDASTDPFIRCVMLCHDIGKATTTEIIDGRWTARGHAEAGVEPTINMLSRIHFRNKKVINQIAFLVQHHMIHTSPPTTKRGVARIMRKINDVDLNFEALVEVCRCDVSGRPPNTGFTPDIGQEMAFEMENDNSIEPIVDGRMLIDVGFNQGPKIGKEKERLFGLQMDGVLNENNWKEFVNV